MVLTKAKQITPGERRLAAKLQDRWWRLNNLYWIINQDGERVKFKPNAPQRELYANMWWRNDILKSRQHGITTAIVIWMLDACLFTANTSCGLIAHKLEDAKKIFRDKVKYAYDNLPKAVRDARSLERKKGGKSAAMELLVSWREKGHRATSSFYVATSMRSGTLNYLHVSEYGPLCTRTPIKAEEIQTGAMPTVHEGNVLFVESTADGPQGHFYEICQEAILKKSPLSKLDFRFFFFAWYQKESNVTDPSLVMIEPEIDQYLDKVEEINQVKLTRPQRAWYAVTRRGLKHLMFKEHPSTPEEAFMVSAQGAFFIEELAKAREDNRITKVPYQPEYPVHTVRDLGYHNRATGLFQVIGNEVHIINAFSESRQPIQEHKRRLDELAADKGYYYGKHFAPHDVTKHSEAVEEELIDVAAKHGLFFEKIPKEKEIIGGIQRVSDMFSRLWIDAEECGKDTKDPMTGKKVFSLLTSLALYRRDWIPKQEMFDTRHAHKGPECHYADMVRYLSYVVKHKMYTNEGTLTEDDIKELERKHGY